MLKLITENRRLSFRYSVCQTYTILKIDLSEQSIKDKRDELMYFINIISQLIFQLHL